MPRRFIVLGTSELAREVALVVEHINENISMRNIHDEGPSQRRMKIDQFLLFSVRMINIFLHSPHAPARG
jgi:hypothetical protein